MATVANIHIYKTSVGLYRDDGLGVFKSHSGPETERKWKEIKKTFNTYNLSITIETNICVVNFLDKTFDLIIFINHIGNQMTTQCT